MIQLFAISQKNDSIGFKLKKLNIGFEIGRSPWLEYGGQYYPSYGLVNKFYPYYKFNLGYNFKIKKNHYINAGLGIVSENLSYTLSSSSFSPFNYTETINTYPVIYSGTKHIYEKQVINQKTLFAAIDLNYQNVASPFKNNKIKYITLAGFSVKSIISQDLNSSYSYSQDSITNNGGYILKDFSNNSSSKYAFQPYSHPYFVLNIRQGLLFDLNSIQNQVGFNFSLQLNTFSEYESYCRRYFFRIFYSINF